MSLVDDAPITVPLPRENPHLIGHEQAEAEMAEAIASGRMHHAWLITGPRGIGKATLAFRFARRLLAGGLEAAGPDLFGDAPPSRDLGMDPDDPVFKRVAAEGHADLFTLERGFADEPKRGRATDDDPRNRRRRTEIVIDDVRKVGGFLSLTALEGGWRVVVDGAEHMNRNAANALLKTLEEPPGHAIVLMVSHAPGRLLPTIRSRCRRLSLSRLDDDAVISLIGRYRPDIDTEDARALALIGAGSIGRALDLADTGGLALYEELVRLVSTLPKLDTARLHGTLEAIARTRNEAGVFQAYDVFTDLIEDWLMRLVTARARGRAPAEIMPGEGEVAARLMDRADLEQWVDVWEKITWLFNRAARLNLDRKQVLLDAFFALGRTVA